jgi:Tol biopolymer transport system component
MNRHVAIVAGAALAALAPGAGAQATRPLAIDDLITAVRVADPQVSPDARRVLFVRTATALPSGKRNADIWTVPADGSASAAPFITGAKSETSPRFLPDGRVAFISTRGGTPQVYVADAKGQAVKQVTRLSGGVQPPLVVSRDGKQVAFVSDTYPSCADEDCNKRTRAAIERDPVKMRHLTRLPFRH